MPAPPPPQKPFTIAIVGGGIGGVTLAIALAAQNIPFHIYESAPSFGEIGAGVTFGPNVIRAIHSISPAMLRAYAKHVTCNESPELADMLFMYRRGDLREKSEDDADGGGTTTTPPLPPEAMFSLSFTTQEIEGLKFPVRCCVHRAHFLDEIVQLVPAGTTSFSKALVRLEEDDESLAGDVRLHFADGSTATASAVIGCDGIRSVTRKHLHGPDAGPQYSGYFAYRAMVPRAEFESILGKEIAATGNLYVCANGYAISYPVDHGTSLNMFATRMRVGQTWDVREPWKVKASVRELAEDLEGWHPGLRALFARRGEAEKWAMFHSPHDQLYFRGRVCLLGDAAHATTPHLGAGAGMAIEDAVVLAKLLGAAESSGDLVRVFGAYDAVRRPRTQDVIRDSRQNLARNAALARAEGEEVERLREEQRRMFGYVINFDLQKSLDTAMGIFKDSQHSVEAHGKGADIS